MHLKTLRMIQLCYIIHILDKEELQLEIKNLKVKSSSKILFQNSLLIIFSGQDLVQNEAKNSFFSTNSFLRLHISR